MGVSPAEAEAVCTAAIQKAGSLLPPVNGTLTITLDDARMN